MTKPKNRSDVSISEEIGRIIVVDDEDMVSTSLTAMLNLEPEFQAKGFNSPKAALEALGNSDMPDVVISDFLMPEMNGIEFLKTVRKHYPDITLILLTGYADKQNAIQAINEADIYRYIEKPWDNDALIIAIRNGIERTRLLKSLKHKIQDLEQAREELKAYSEHLEERVTEKTRDLTSALNKLKVIVENTGDAILTMNKHGMIQGANPTFVRWVGQKMDQISGKMLTDFLRFKDNITIEDLFSLEESSNLLEGHLGNIPVEVNLSPLPGHEGAVLIFRDIARRKEAERLREDFVSTLTHDLRTPLLAAIQSLGFFEDGTLGNINEKQHEMIEMLIDSNKQMLELVNDLLEIYRYEAKQQKLILEDVQLADVVHQVLLELQSLAKTKDQDLKTDIIEPIPPVKADKQALRRVITNLVGNAIHYTPIGGNIWVTAKVGELSTILSIIDNGRGIPQKDIKYLFERFIQGTSKHRNTGSGLGLYLSRQIIEAHGGRIWAESVEGEGSTFAFELKHSSRIDPTAVKNTPKAEQLH